MKEKSKDLAVNRIFEESDFFQKMITKKATTALNIDTCTDNDVAEAKTMVTEVVKVIGAEDPIQLMLTTQMMAVHELQQRMAVYCHNAPNSNNKISYAGMAVKLSNVYVQQAALLQKLQAGSQVRVGEVHVHDGGQAVVGNVEVKK
jgi:hypothetical protein